MPITQAALNSVFLSSAAKLLGTVLKNWFWKGRALDKGLVAW